MAKQDTSNFYHCLLLTFVAYLGAVASVNAQQPFPIEFGSNAMRATGFSLVTVTSWEDYKRIKLGKVPAATDVDESEADSDQNEPAKAINKKAPARKSLPTAAQASKPVALNPLERLRWLAAASYTFYEDFEPDRKAIYSELDGVELSLALFGLGQGSNGALPAILFFHGGTWTGGSPTQFYPWAKHYAELGWVAVSAEYRLNGRDGTNAFDAVADARAAYFFLQQNAPELGIDPHRIVLAGGSAGGHLAAAVAMTPWSQRGAVPAPAALVLFNPVLNTVYGKELGLDHLFEDRGEQISPMHHIIPGLPPTIILHGDKDWVVPITGSRDFCKRMVAVDNRCELIEYQGAGHDWFNWGGDNYDEVLADVVNYTGDQP